MAETKKTAAALARRIAAIQGRLDAIRAAEVVAAQVAAEDRAARAVLSTYSPRREWRTRYGAVFVEGLGFVRLA